jgi:hypothetical protein
MATKQPENQKQRDFFDALLETESVSKAAEKADYTREYAYELAKKYQEYFLDLVMGKLVLSAPAAVNRVIDGMDSTGKDVGEKTKISSAQDVLDRIGIAKQTRMDVKVEGDTGVILLPKKDDGK